MADLAYRLAEHERILRRHEQLLQVIATMRGYEEYLEDHSHYRDEVDILTDGATVKKRRKVAQKILPIVFRSPEPLRIYRREPISHPKFGNPLRWLENNLQEMGYPKSIMELIDLIEVAYGVIYNSWDVRTTGPYPGRRIPLGKRERIGGDNDLFGIWKALNGVDEPVYMAGIELRSAAGFHRKGVQAVVSGFNTIKHADFLSELQEIGGYARDLRWQYGYRSLEPDDELSPKEVRKMLKTISDIGETQLKGEKPGEEFRELMASGLRITHDLVTDAWFVRS